ncbi:hypothetical protein L198_01633 [Cryptococcus wingfieldii CBS 7118]|uniref:Uncharacterized protein n=1 Tax=Cryptococcus wingfieldii CBS 7118 TaxID=1295528 RepID=A0A1E3K051_9TREE|nr:hypothetical protein L198_01633 [Cryptococcus wingfieldii CBS 7118]ODO06401.1 hypothetical protein L198_01633 [Cryptococcus wingfieldii CBS 7118]
MGIPVVGAIIIGLACSFIQSLGLTIQRKSHVQEDDKPLLARRPAIRRPLWLIGFAVYITSNVFGSVFQLDALPIVILAPLGAVSLVFNALLARLLLGDKFGVSWVIGTGLVAGGAVTIAIFGVVPDEEHGLDELLALLARGSFVAFFTIVLFITGAVLALAHFTSWHIYRNLQRNVEEETSPISMPPSNYASPRSPAAIPFRTTRPRSVSPPSKPTSEERDSPLGLKTPTRWLPALSIPSNHLEENHEQPTSSQARTLTSCGLGFAAASGTLSGLCLVLAKAVVELFMKTVDHWRTGAGRNEFARAETWVVLLGMSIIAVAQIWYLHVSLRYAGPALVCPLAFCFFNLSSIFAGLVFYDQFGQLATYQILLVSLGTALLLLGVWIVSAIQPEGAAVEVGTWVEDNCNSDSESDVDEELEAGEGATLLGGDTSNEPESSEPARHPRPSDLSIPPTPPGRYHPVFAPSPGTPASPLSPRIRQHSHSQSHGPHGHRHRGPRYGTLIPDIGPHGAPAGFSIGLGAASPGFALRSGSMSEYSHHPHGHGTAHHGSGSLLGPEGRNRRSGSDGPLGLGAIMRGENPDVENQIDARDQEGDVEEALRGWDTQRTTRRWWDVRRLWKGEGKIRLAED